MDDGAEARDDFETDPEGDAEGLAHRGPTRGRAAHNGRCAGMPCGGTGAAFVDVP